MSDRAWSPRRRRFSLCSGSSSPSVGIIISSSSRADDNMALATVARDMAGACRRPAMLWLRFAPSRQARPVCVSEMSLQRWQRKRRRRPGTHRQWQGKFRQRQDGSLRRQRRWWRMQLTSPRQRERSPRPRRQGRAQQPRSKRRTLCQRRRRRRLLLSLRLWAPGTRPSGDDAGDQ